MKKLSKNGKNMIMLKPTMVIMYNVISYLQSYYYYYYYLRE